MGRGSKRKRRSDDLAALLKLQSFKDIFQSKMSVAVKGNMLNIKTCLKFLLKLLMLYTHVGDPVGIPKVFYLIGVFFNIRH